MTTTSTSPTIDYARAGNTSGMRSYAVDVRDGTGERCTLNYWTASVSAIPEAVARESAQFLAAHPTQVEHAALTILAIRPR